MKYTLEPYKGKTTRYECPQCEKKQTFSRYIDTATNSHLNNNVGRCNRIIKCGYHYKPKEYFESKGVVYTPDKTIITRKQKPISFIDYDLFKYSLICPEDNFFIKFLITTFGIEKANELVRRYLIGSSKHWKGATVFWQIDINGKIRTGKIMLYSPNTGKRIKEPYNHINWVHSVLKLKDYELSQSLFGEHLLNDNKGPVAIVESEKTAIIASAYLPNFIWLAVGSICNLTLDRCKVLKGRKVILYPDLNGFELWSKKAKKYGFEISDILERKASEAEKEQALDIADYLISFA